MDILNGIMDIGCERSCSTDKGFTLSMLQVL